MCCHGQVISLKTNLVLCSYCHSSVCNLHKRMYRILLAFDKKQTYSSDLMFCFVYRAMLGSYVESNSTYAVNLFACNRFCTWLLYMHQWHECPTIIDWSLIACVYYSTSSYCLQHSGFVTLVKCIY